MIDMITIDSVRIIALQPLRDFDNTPESTKTIHRNFNYGFMAFTLFLMFIVPIGKYSVYHFCKNYRFLLDWIGDLLMWVFLPLTIMWAIGYCLQVLQCLDYSNQPQSPNVQKSCEIIKSVEVDHVTIKNTNGPGRPANAKLEHKESPLKDEIVREALDNQMNEYANHELSAIDGRYHIDALRLEWKKYLKDYYNYETLAEWFYDNYKTKFHEGMKTSRSMTTIEARKLDNGRADEVKNSLSSKYMAILKKRKIE